MRPFLRASLWSFAFAVNGYSQDPTGPVVQLDPFVVTAHPSGADERAAAVWVVAPESAVLPATSFAELFHSVPGLTVDQPGGAGGRSTLYLRGGEENHTVVFLDGIPLNDPTNNRGGAVDLSLLEPALLRSAAVVRGPAAVRYGPDALAGVVHLGGANVPANSASLLVEGGGDHFRRAALSASRALGDGKSAVQLGLAGTDDGTLAAGSRARRRFYRGAFTTALGTANLQAALWHARHEADSFPDESGGRDYAVLRTLEHRENRQTAGSLRVDGATGGEGRWSASVDAAQLEATVTSPGVAAPPDNPYAGVPASTDDTRLRRYRAAGGYEDTWRGWRTAVGIDFQREQGRSAGTLVFGPTELPTDFSATRDRLGAHAETSGPLGKNVALVAGARADRYDDNVTRGTFRGGLLGTIDPTTQWRLNAGTAFKPASFYALSNPLVGDANLRPERARALDAGLRRTFAGGRLLVDFTGFLHHIRDGVDYDSQLGRLVNRTAIRSRGAELATTWRPCDALSFAGSLTYTNAHSEPGDARLRSRPEWRSGVSATWTPVKALDLTVAWTASSDIPDTAKPTGAVVLGGWARVDLGARWRVTERIAVTAALDNALDKSYAEAVGFAAPGRRLRVGVQATF